MRADVPPPDRKSIPSLQIPLPWRGTPCYRSGPCVPDHAFRTGVKDPVLQDMCDRACVTEHE
jgi:hypothetical protein